MIDQSENKLRLIFVNKEMLETAKSQPTEPLWHLWVGDERTLKAMISWAMWRCAEWPTWGRIAEEQGRAALAETLAKRMELDPPVEVLGVVIKVGAQHNEIALGELVSTTNGSREHIHYVHAFESEELRDTFRTWLLANNPEGNGNAMIDLALRQGTDSLAEVMTKIANEEQQGPKAA